MLPQKNEFYKYVLPLKNWVYWITTRREKNVTASRMYVFVKNCLKVKNMLFFHLVTTLYNFALKIETSWAKRARKPILETWNANDVTVYVWFIHSLTKSFKNMQCKKYHSKCPKSTIKNKNILNWIQD